MDVFIFAPLLALGLAIIFHFQLTKLPGKWGEWFRKPVIGFLLSIPASLVLSLVIFGCLYVIVYGTNALITMCVTNGWCSESWLVFTFR